MVKSILLTCDIQIFNWLNRKYFKLVLGWLEGQFLASNANCGKLYLLTFKGGGELKLSAKSKKHTQLIWNTFILMGYIFTVNTLLGKLFLIYYVREVKEFAI